MVDAYDRFQPTAGQLAANCSAQPVPLAAGLLVEDALALATEAQPPAIQLGREGVRSPDIAPAGPQRRLRSGWLNGIKEMPVAYR